MRAFKIYICLFLIILASCSKEDENIPVDIEVQDFVWKGMNAYYYWQSDVANLADTRFSSQNELNAFLSEFLQPEELFESLRYQPGVTDRFSIMVDDYIALENSLQGIRVTNGMQFKLFRNATGNGNVYGVVFNVVPNSSAFNNNVKRGMVFNAINNVALTETNYRALLFGANTVYSVDFADFNNGNPSQNGLSISLTKTELQENPIAIAKVFNEPTSKIGYLLYNQFASNFDFELNAVFSNFKAEGITDLIIDLRYNGGGSVQTATFLASMINGTHTGELFSQEVWNEKVMANTDPSFFLNNFTNTITKITNNTTIEEPINSLSLTRVYFIVTGDTASASELVINGMMPYADVQLIGTQTVGKQVGSVTLYDSDNYSRNNTSLNTNHTYALQPIVLEIKNADNTNNPNGFVPNVIIEEDFGSLTTDINLGVLGEKSDPLLNQTIDFITNGVLPKQKTTPLQKNSLVNSKFMVPFSQEMVSNKRF